MRRVVLLVGVLAAAVSLWAVPTAACAAQAATSQALVQGTVLDASGAPIVGAVITIASDNQTAGPSTTTDERGEFSFQLGAGRYTVTVVAPGFAEASQTLTLSPGGAPVIAVRIGDRRLARSRDRQRARRLPGRRHEQCHQDADAGPGRPAVDHRRDAGVDEGSADDECRRRRPIRAGHYNPTGREQSRSDHRARQQHIGRLLREWRPRRRAVLPGPLQPRTDGGAQGPKRHDLRPRRWRRCRKPHPEGSRVSAAAGGIPPRRYAGEQAVDDGSEPAGRREGRGSPQRHVRELGQLSHGRRPRALRPDTDRDDCAERADESDAQLRIPPRCAHGRPRDHVIPERSRQRRSRAVLRQPE